MASATRATSAQFLSGYPASGRSYSQSGHLVPSGSTLAASLNGAPAVQHSQNDGNHTDQAHGGMHSSCTWTSTSGDLGLLNDADEVEDRSVFVLEYNRLAKKVLVLRLVLGLVSNTAAAWNQAISPRRL